MKRLPGTLSNARHAILVFAALATVTVLCGAGRAVRVRAQDAPAAKPAPQEPAAAPAASPSAPAATPAKSAPAPQTAAPAAKESADAKSPQQSGAPAAKEATPAAKAAGDQDTQEAAAPAAPAPSRLPRGSGILLDPAHGGDDPGAQLAPNLMEKDVNLSLSARLKPSLEAKGLSVRATRESDTAVTAARRNAAAQSAAPIACLALHTSASGSGIHIFTALPPVADLSGSPLLSWSQVQSDILPESRALAGILQQAFQAAGLQASVGEAAIAPLSGYACPAVAIEAAPLSRGAGAGLADSAYQQRITDAIAAAMAQWRAKRQGAAQ